MESKPKDDLKPKMQLAIEKLKALPPASRRRVLEQFRLKHGRCEAPKRHDRVGPASPPLALLSESGEPATKHLKPEELQEQGLPPMTLCGGPLAGYDVALESSPLVPKPT